MSGALKRRTPLRRGKPPKPVNRRRKAEAYARNFGEESEYVRGLPCLVAVKLGHAFWSERGICDGSVVAMHVVSRGAGGGRFDLVGACSHHHDESHTIGIVSFAETYGLKLRAAADSVAIGHASPLGIRGLAQRWSALQSLDGYDLDALLGWVRREIERDDRIRQVMARNRFEPKPGWLSRVIANVLGIDAEPARDLCEAAGWQEVGS